MNGGTSGKGTPDQNQFPGKKKEDRTSKSSRPKKRYRMRQEQGLVRSTSAMVYSAALLQVQADRERRLPQKRTMHAAPLRVGTTGTRQQGATTFPPKPAPVFPTAPAQARGTPTFQTALTLAPVQRTCNTMAEVAVTAPNPSVHGFLRIFNLLEDGANTTPQLRLKRLATLPLKDSPPLVV